MTYIKDPYCVMEDMTGAQFLVFMELCKKYPDRYGEVLCAVAKYTSTKKKGHSLQDVLNMEFQCDYLTGKKRRKLGDMLADEDYVPSVDEYSELGIWWRNYG